MKFITGKDRAQIPLFASSIDQAISENNEVRLIDLFVDSLSLKDFGFKLNFIENGRPAYHPSDLLKIYIYGYMNRIRSSRQLEKECYRNIEMMWLLRGLAPDHNTISNFRKDNPKAIRRVFQATVSIAKNFDLIGGKLLAGDGTKLRAQNSKKNNFTHSKIERHIAYIDAKLDEYDRALANNEEENSVDHKDEIKRKYIESKINKHGENKAKYESFKEQLDKTGEVQISTSDPQSRQMITRNNITEVAYNVQTTVDAKHNIPIDFKVTNQNDSKAMGGMVRRAKTILGHNDFTAIYDKGYHTGSEFEYAKKNGVEVIVAIPDVASHAPDISFDIEHFRYKKEEDHYICPEGQLIPTNGRWYSKQNGKTLIRVKHYKTKACLTCQSFVKCTKNKAGRLIERSEYSDLIFENKQRMEANLEIYRKRQAIVEHPFGIIKRQWDFYYIMTKKSIKRASSDVGLIFTAFNLRRIFNLLDKNELKKYLKMLGFIFLILKSHFKAIRETFYINKLKSKNIKSLLSSFLKGLYLTKNWFEFEFKLSF
jgi:transposase